MSYNYVEINNLFVLLCLVNALVGKTIYNLINQTSLFIP